MANKMIKAAVNGEYIGLSDRVAGAAGSFNAVSLALTFDSAWDGTTKKVYFFDAYGANAVYVLLTVDLYDSTTGAYTVPIPAEPLAYAGEMTITIRGVELDGETTERIIMSASTTLKVLSAITPTSDVAPVEPTPTQAEQLQAEIDAIIDEIGGSAANAAAALASANAAAESATAAANSATAASGYASSASASATAAGNSATAASGYSASALTAKTAAEAAQSAAETAKTAAQTAQGLAETAKAAAELAETIAETAKTNAETARSAAEAAQGLAEAANTAAQGAKTAALAAQAAAEAARAGAETAEDNAADSAEDAEAWAVGQRGGVDVGTGDPTYHNNSKWYKDQAAAIIGGDYLLRTGDGKDLTVTFTGAATRANIATGETLATMFGKIKKYFTDLGTAAYQAASAFAAAVHTHTKSQITDFPTIPDQLSDLTDDATHRLVTDTEKTTWNGKQDALGYTPYHSGGTDVAIADGGTGASTAPAGMYNLIDALSAITPVSADLFPFLDASGSTAGKVSLTNLAAALGGAKVASGTYTGTGTAGSSNPTSLAIGFVPKLVVITRSGVYGNDGEGTDYYDDTFLAVGSTGGFSSGYVYAGGASRWRSTLRIKSWGTTVQFYGGDAIEFKTSSSYVSSVTTSSNHQCNSTKSYTWVAIG